MEFKVFFLCSGCLAPFGGAGDALAPFLSQSQEVEV